MKWEDRYYSWRCPQIRLGRAFDRLVSWLGRVFTWYAIAAVTALIWFNTARVFRLPNWQVALFTTLAFLGCLAVGALLLSGGRGND